GRCWRWHENHRMRLADQVADPLLPIRATGDALTVDEALKAAGIERRNQLAGEAQIVAAVGDEDAKFIPFWRVGSARLLRSYITRFRRRTGCVMRHGCHCAPPPPDSILAHRPVRRSARYAAEAVAFGVELRPLSH